MTQPVELRAAWLLLRAWRDDDAPAVLAAGDEAIELWNATAALDHDSALAWVRRRADWSPGDHASYAVVDAVSDDLLGSVSLYALDPEQGTAEVGYWTVPAARGRGVAAIALDTLCRWAFATLPVDRIELCHAIANPASGRVAARAGFTREGTLRQSYRYGDGRKYDEHLWSRLATDPPPATARAGARTA